MTCDMGKSGAACEAGWASPLQWVFERAQDPLRKHVSIFEETSGPVSTCKVTNHSIACGLPDPACSLHGKELPGRDCFPLFQTHSCFPLVSGFKGVTLVFSLPRDPDARGFVVLGFSGCFSPEAPCSPWKAGMGGCRAPEGGSSQRPVVEGRGRG